MSLLQAFSRSLQSGPRVLGLLLSLYGLAALKFEDLLQVVEDLGDLGLGCAPGPLELVLGPGGHLDLLSLPQRVGLWPRVVCQSAASD